MGVKGRQWFLKEAITMTGIEAMYDYLLFKKALGLREITLRGHQDVIELLFKRHPDSFDQQSIKKAVYLFMGENIKPATYNIRRNYLKQFFDWCIREGIFTENPLEHLKKRKDEPRIVDISPESLMKLIRLPNRKTFSGVRDLAMILISLDTGIRPAEALSITIDDIDFHRGEVLIRPDNSKTNTSRKLPVSAETLGVFNVLIENRPANWSKDVPVICSSDGKRFNRNTWNHRLSDYSKKIGVRIRPYDLRHCFSLQYLRNGGNAIALQRTLGHSTMLMTKRYVNLSQDDLKEQHRKASPLNTLLPKSRRVGKIKGLQDYN